jgi:Holliday junction DNA helicase RuvA
MISRIIGVLITKNATNVEIDCGGIGYQIFVSMMTLNKLSEIGDKVELHTILIHREDAMQLYGFYDKIEREVFKLLTTISGIGPKSAIAILSSITVGELQTAVSQGNLHLLQKMPGIGKKTAERLIVELRDKITKLEIEGTEGTDTNRISQEAISALVTLGYNKMIAEKSVKKALTTDIEQELSLEELIRNSLKIAIN